MLIWADQVNANTIYNDNPEAFDLVRHLVSQACNFTVMNTVRI